MLEEKTRGNLTRRGAAAARSGALRAAHALRRSEEEPEPDHPAVSVRSDGWPLSDRAACRVTFLGTGTSHGVPMIGCACATCRSTDPRDRRLRPSIYRRGPTAVRSVLVDTSTDLRQQALTHGLTRVDAILFTHSHADHVMGLDEVRRFNVLQRASIPRVRRRADARRTCAARSATFSIRRRRRAAASRRSSCTTIDGPFAFDGVSSIRRCRSSRQPADSRLSLRVVRLPDRLQRHSRLIVAAARRARRPRARRAAPSAASHALQRGRSARRRRLASRRSQTYFTHICHDLPHAATNAALPPGVELAYDGLTSDRRSDGWHSPEPHCAPCTPRTPHRAPYAPAPGTWHQAPLSRHVHDMILLMEVARFPDDPRPARWHAPVLALGNFDGLHRGHIKIIERVRRVGRRARRHRARADLRPAPAAHRPARQGAAAADDARAEDRSAGEGRDSGRRHRPVHARALALGARDVRQDACSSTGCASPRSGWAPTSCSAAIAPATSRCSGRSAGSYGFRAEKIDPVRYKEFVVSSTRIRRLVAEGRVDEAGRAARPSFLHRWRRSCAGPAAAARLGSPRPTSRRPTSWFRRTASMRRPRPSMVSSIRA